MPRHSMCELCYQGLPHPKATERLVKRSAIDASVSWEFAELKFTYRVKRKPILLAMAE
jgi:hypothetical protein